MSRAHPQQSGRARPRQRSYSDPFSDPHQPRLPPNPPSKHPPRMSDKPLPEQPLRTRSGRSQTVVANQPPAAPRSGRRSMSQDSVLHAANALEKAKAKPRGKKGSVHADVIDRLDFSGVGPMFHHDGPFDACAPSRNRHRTKAPMLAWSSPPAPDAAESSYSSPDPYKAAFFPTYDIPKKKVDAIAEAWGIHEPEPYEEFFAGGGSARRDGDTPANSIYAGRDGHSSRHATPQHSIGRRSKDGRDLREVYREYLDDDIKPQARDKDRNDRVGRRTARGILPPPQPIMVPEAHLSDVESGPVSPSGVPKRTKSLMQRIRKMRDSPNVPVAYDDLEKPSSPTLAEAYRPTHRPQNSLFGRFAGGNGTNADRRGNMKENMSPVSDNSETYVYIDNPRKEKQLPATPYAPGPVPARTPSGEDGHPDFDGSPVPGSGLGRKTSLLKKVKDVVRGPK